jgi:hypothetical protein
LPCDPDFGGVPFCRSPGGAGLDLDGGLDCEPAAVVLVELDAAAAPAMPVTAPPAASAPVTIVAPSSLEIVIATYLLGRFDCCAKERASPG